MLSIDGSSDSLTVLLYSISMCSFLDFFSSSSEDAKPLNTGGENSSDCETGRIADGILGEKIFSRFFFPIPFVFTNKNSSQ